MNARYPWKFRVFLALFAATLPLATGRDGWWIGSLFAIAAVLVVTHRRNRFFP